MGKTVFTEIFNDLKKIIQPYSDNLVCKVDTEDEYHLDTDFFMKNKKPLFFGAVKINKNYVSFHLMPVYVNPNLLKDISDALKKRIQGKSCFNFSSCDSDLFNELADLTQAAYRFYIDEGYV